MQKVIVRLDAEPEAAYTIFIGGGLLEKIAGLYPLGGYSSLFVITDENVAPLFLNKLAGAVRGKSASIALAAGEEHKNINSIQKIWKAMHQAGCDRKSLVINLGGGVIGDLGGFAAATYMRGVDFLNVPTTLLAQVDASIGGKTGFNFAGIKNLIGSFNQPVAVVIDPQTLSTLPKRELVAGFGEVIKHGLVADMKYFDYVTAKAPHEFSAIELEAIVAGSCQIKKQIVQADVKENAARRLVNFGHTVGHAVETLSLETSAPLLHGEAVSIGMLAEARISEYQGILPAGDLKRIETALRRAGLPTTVIGFTPDEILGKMQSDKKNEYGSMNFTLLSSIGRAEYNRTVDQALVVKAVKTILKG